MREHLETICPPTATVASDLEHTMVLTIREQGERFSVETDPPCSDYEELPQKMGNAGKPDMPILPT
ncbi:Hypothetical predicted protein [Paramuricea clavata]|uniref:Uncharacterized protein n=1 Tax=Paramuricea clavata TaxID=317549 RepID=A0A7D9KAU6_PARCT|nr:Hypothetical predicted protein [Paramuricea clavata]